MEAKFNHFDAAGNAVMVDVGGKAPTERAAAAEGSIKVSRPVLEAIKAGTAAKGDVLGVARVAGIMGTKRTWELIPLCHPLMLTHLAVDFEILEEACAVRAVCTARLTGKTGVEMEALTGVSAALLTIYDMCKAHQRDMVITEVRLLEKDGGKSVHFVRAEGDAPTAPLDASAAAAPAASELPHGTVVATCISEKEGTRKHPVDSIELVVGKGIAGDAHAGTWHRQVSLLANESVDLMRAKGIDLAPGDFAENVLTRGIDVKSLPVGTTVAVGPARMVVTQIGKTCHNDCEIRRLTGMCVMPTDGIFCVVTRGGIVRAGDEVRVMGEDELA